MKNETKSLRELADYVGGVIQGDADVLIQDLAPFDSAADGEITFLLRKKDLQRIETIRASAVIVPEFISESPMPQIMVKNPNVAAAKIHAFFCEVPFPATGIHPSAHIGSECLIPAAVSVGPMAVLGDRVKLGERVVIEPGVVIGDDVEIGSDTVLAANVTILFGCIIGKRVRIHSGAVIGADGFGYATDEQGRHFKRPQVGNVRIDDDVEIGVNTCVDRATFGTTWIQSGVKIDNLVQVGHNVVVGQGSILVAQVGIAGSSTLGRGVVLGGQVGVGDHVELGDRVMVAAQSGIINNQQAGAVVSGSPTIAHRKWLRSTSVFARLPDMAKELKMLRKEVEYLRQIGDEKKKSLAASGSSGGKK